MANICVSAVVAALSMLLLQLLLRRRLSITRLTDLVQLSLLYALMNALMHHLLWSWIDPSQLMFPNQIFEMVLGDINGALMGALVLRWLAKRTRLAERLRNRVSA
jgi:hypothetical protein